MLKKIGNALLTHNVTISVIDHLLFSVCKSFKAHIYIPIYIYQVYHSKDWILSNKLQKKHFGKWFEPRGISYLFGVIVRVKVIFRKTVVGD